MYQFIVNSLSGGGKAKKNAIKLEKEIKKYSCNFQFHFPSSSAESTLLAKTLSTNKDNIIIVVGGDGTTRGIINGIPNNTPIGLIPSGTGNDFAKTIGIPKNYKKALALIMKNKITNYDYLIINNQEKAFNIVGTGLDVEVLKNREQMKIRGKLGYYLALLKTLLAFTHYDLELEIDGHKSQEQAFIIVAGNGKYLGGGMKICPNASPNDGKISMVLIKKISKSKILSVLPCVLRGKHLEKNYTKYCECEELKIKSIQKLKLDADGEVFSVDEVSICVVRNGLSIFNEG